MANEADQQLLLIAREVRKRHSFGPLQCLEELIEYYVGHRAAVAVYPLSRLAGCARRRPGVSVGAPSHPCRNVACCARPYCSAVRLALPASLPRSRTPILFSKLCSPWLRRARRRRSKASTRNATHSAT